MAGDEFAALLGQLKERSGLSYGTLGKRLHLSASTLHRYVNGDAVPVDYAPVERFARLCRATPDELVELHRLWVRADVSRQRKTPAAVGPDSAAEPEPSSAESVESVVPVVPVESHEPASEASTTEPAPPDERVASEPTPAVAAPPPQERRRFRRTAVIVGSAVVAAAVSVALVMNLSGGDGPEKGRWTGDAAMPSGTTAGVPEQSAKPGPSDAKTAAHAPTVATAPHTWEGPCTQHYLLDREPEQVPPPPTEQDAPGWIAALDAVPGGDQLLRLTVQGTGKQTVVLEALHVRVVSKKAPLAWNDYVMGVGCGGSVSTKAFAVDLDAGRPTAVPVGGQRTFSYKTSESDPVIVNVAARAQAHDVSWYLELVWSSGKEHGTLRVDDDGRPFRTSGNLARPAYAYPLGWTEWIDNDVDTSGR
ncbi:helix-turn-helix transcriptional regulator [Streptomyces sp. NBC_00572]|uniref:helix-turn-helix domain-containing protein n=1 Tax=Streptomyces sp. NBC_00572 TaxID=2903664 RepID=UPI002252F76B|nr:helix-turn-helix transcriptional regulator [Streptomyces sp. NBC_00572]MCX4984828.1 helix-turn-helix domain-containing protein [Streptomyces sp. NBC_00572]